MIFRAASSVSVAHEKIAGAWMRGRARRAASLAVGRVIIYELWGRRNSVGGNIVMNMLSSARSLEESTSASTARERLYGGLFIPLLTFSYAHCERRCTNCNILPGTEISWRNERSPLTFGMQIRQTVVCKRTYATQRYGRPLWDPLRRFLHYINLNFSKATRRQYNM